MFIKKVIGPDEKLIGMCTAHWIYGAIGLFWLAASMIVGAYVNTHLVDFYSQSPDTRVPQMIVSVGSSVFWVCTVMGVTLFLLYFIMMVSTEVGLTNKRVIFKKGLIFTDVKEVDLEEIKAAQVNNGILGRVFNYGYIFFDARFVSNMTLPAIGKPYVFVQALNAARTEIKEDSMTVVLENKAEAVAEEIKEKVETPAPAAARETAPQTRAEIDVAGQAPPTPAKVSKRFMRKKPKKAPIGKHGRPVVFNKGTWKKRLLENFTDITTHEDAA